MFLMEASEGEALNGFVLFILRLYPLTCFKGTKGKSLRVKLFGIGLWLILNFKFTTNKRTSASL